MIILFIALLVAILFLIFENIKLQNKIKRAKALAECDPLTGAYNRNGFISKTEKVLMGSTQKNEYAILFFNIKGFKVINELFGIEGGDDVLRESVERLQNSTLNPIFVARFEADHFVCLMRQKDLNYDKLTEMCHRIYVRDDKKFNFYGRVGIYLIADTTKGVSGMCDRAKLAEDYIQDDFAKPYSVYDINMRNGFVTKKELTSELSRALDSQEFEVYYQPVYNLKTGDIASAEALVRWNHPERGLLMPGYFIPIFEENGFISELDCFIGNQSTKFLQDRISENKFSVPVAVNLSRMDFYDTKLLETMLTNIKEVRLPVGHPRIEITESAYSSLVKNDSGFLRHIKDMGIKILLDDFGSGYSSFSSLREFDFDIIKLDMGFIRQIGVNKKSKKIIRSIIELAHEIGSQVIAEGVETKEQADFLTAANCDFVQGYLYSKPITQQAFGELLDRCQIIEQ